MKNIQELLIPVIKDALEDLKIKKGQIADLYLDLPTVESFGELSTNIALRLSKILRKSPTDIAKTLTEFIKQRLKKSPARKYVKEVKAEGAGFINFYLEDRYFYEQLKDIILKGRKSLQLNIGRNKRVLIEFVSANPTGPLSVAHARQAAVGDALANILRFLGFKVKKEFYLNDEGNQIDILGRSVELRIRELAGEKIEFPQDYYQGDYIYDIAKIVPNAQCPMHSLGDFAANYILGIIKKELEDFGVRFDYWYSQKELTKSGRIKKALDFLRKKKFVYDLEGASWFKSTQFGDDKDRVVIKSDGSYTYLAPDIAYHQDKYKRGFQWLINLWGPDHHGYVPRLKAAVTALGYDPQSLSIVIVQLATIFRDGKSIEMSTRKGQYITLREVLDEVGVDASRFFFLMRRTSSHLDFDLDVAKKQTPENPVYYVQYAHARICSILRNSTLKPRFKKANLTLLKEKEELHLVKKILQFSYILDICHKTEDPYMLTVYLQEIAESFHKFYDQHRVLGQDEDLTQARISLIEATRIVIATGLQLLGLAQPKKM